MTADHGTPNTGDERDREVARGDEALPVMDRDWQTKMAARSSQDEDREDDHAQALAEDAAGIHTPSPSPSRDGTVGEGHGVAEAKVLEVMASPSYATATDEQRAKWIVNHMARDGTVAVEALRRIRERVMTFGGFQRTPQGEFWVARDDVLRLVDELLAEFGVSERTERIHDQATKEEER